MSRWQCCLKLFPVSVTEWTLAQARLARGCLALGSLIMSNQLTAEQQRMIEENRRKALERRAQRLARANPGDGQAQLLSPKGASELANSKVANVQRATPAVATAAAKQFVAPVKQHQSRVDTPGNYISHAARCVSNEVSSRIHTQDPKVWLCSMFFLLSKCD